jgi:exosortase A-associated hydrolase 2
MSGTAVGGRIDVEPFFLDTPGGRVFAVHHAPRAPRGHVLCVQGFNEELNRCRSMLTLQARALAAHGIGTLVVDLLGTGDSDGGYVDARWDRWLANLSAAAALLEQRGGLKALLGIRLGCMLALDWLGAKPAATRRLVAWQPVVDGKQYFTQFLRIRIAANMDRTDLPKETTGSMREQLAGGTPVEVAGYEVHPELAAAIDARHLARMRPPPGVSVAWLEQLNPGGEVPSPVSAKAISAWQGEGTPVEVIPYGGQAFWQLHERSLALEAIERTTAWLTQEGT